VLPPNCGNVAMNAEFINSYTTAYKLYWSYWFAADITRHSVDSRRSSEVAELYVSLCKNAL